MGLRKRGLREGTFNIIFTGPLSFLASFLDELMNKREENADEAGNTACQPKLKDTEKQVLTQPRKEVRPCNPKSYGVDFCASSEYPKRCRLTFTFKWCWLPVSICGKALMHMTGKNGRSSQVEVSARKGSTMLPTFTRGACRKLTRNQMRLVKTLGILLGSSAW